MMRYPDGSLIGNLNDNFDATTSSSLSQIALSDVNENQTVYDLLPVVINKPPQLTIPIVSGSSPQIKQISLTNGTGENIYVNQDGLARVCINTTITLSMTAIQPEIYNVENGIPTIIPDTSKLTYRWKVNENVVGSFSIPSLQSTLTIEDNQLTISSIQLQHNGTYTCEVSNDIGTVVSEPINIEVYSPEADPLLFNNLIQNGFAEEGVDGWNSSSPNDFVSKEMSLLSAEQLKTVNAINSFGYTSDMMHPRPYQIEPGFIRQSDYSSRLTEGGNYFSRSNYRLVSMGGVNFVKAYQDIDLTDLTQVISGGVYGIRGLRAIFGCYIGQAVSNYKPTTELTPLNRRVNRREYFLGAPRLSAENWLSAGYPEIIDRAYVTIEEFENETRLPSVLRLVDGNTQTRIDTITLNDPYTITEYNGRYYPGSERFPTDVFDIGIETPSETLWRDQIFYKADQLMPEYGERFTYGQYVEFNRIVLDKLNPRTNKIRISIVFECDNYRVLDPSIYVKDLGGEVRDFIGWDRPVKKNAFGDDSDSEIIGRILSPVGSESIPAAEKFLTQPEPRPMVTGLSLGLVPILNDFPSLTEEYTNTTLAQNDLPESSVDSTLLDIPFDPLGRNNKDLEVTFFNETSFSSSSRDLTALQIKVVPRAGASWLFTPSQSLFPFTEELPVDIRNNNTLSDTSELKTWRVMSSRRGAQIGTGSFGSVSSASLPNNLQAYRFIPSQTATAASLNLTSDYYARAYGQSGKLTFDENGTLSQPRIWSNKSRFILHYTSRKRVGDQDLEQYAQDNKVLADNYVLGLSSQNNTLTNKVDQLNQALKYNSYILEIQTPSQTNNQITQSIATLSRPIDLVGSGQLSPLNVEHGVSQNKFFFKLPSTLLGASPMEGGMGFGYDANLVARNVEVPRANEFPVDFLAVNASEWWRLGQLFGDQARRQVLASVFPAVEEQVVSIAALTAFGIVQQTTPPINEHPGSWQPFGQKPLIPFSPAGRSGSLFVDDEGFVVFPAITQGQLELRVQGTLSLSKFVNASNDVDYVSPSRIVMRVRAINPFTNALDEHPIVASKTIELEQAFSDSNLTFEQTINEVFSIDVDSLSFAQKFAITLDYNLNGPVLPVNLFVNDSTRVVNRIAVVGQTTVNATVITTPIVPVTAHTDQRLALVEGAKQRLYTLLSSSAVDNTITNLPSYNSALSQIKQDYVDLWGESGQDLVIKSTPTSRSIDLASATDPTPNDQETYVSSIVSGSMFINYTTNLGEAFASFIPTQSGSLTLAATQVSSSTCVLCFLNDSVLSSVSGSSVELGQPTVIQTGSRNYDYAASLYAVQALSYGSEDGGVLGGTPAFGYDQERNTYNVVIMPIVDTIIRDTPPIPTPLI